MFKKKAKSSQKITRVFIEYETNNRLVIYFYSI